jgi:hypothetical protein
MIFTLNHLPDLELELEMDSIPIHSRNESTIEFPNVPLTKPPHLNPPTSPSPGTLYIPNRPTKNKHNPKNKQPSNPARPLPPPP